MRADFYSLDIRFFRRPILIKKINYCFHPQKLILMSDDFKKMIQPYILQSTLQDL